MIAGFKVVGELQDLRLCNLAISRIPNAALSKGWRVALALLGGLRRWGRQQVGDSEAVGVAVDLHPRAVRPSAFRPPNIWEIP